MTSYDRVDFADLFADFDSKCDFYVLTDEMKSDLSYFVSYAYSVGYFKGVKKDDR